MSTPPASPRLSLLTHLRVSLVITVMLTVLVSGAYPLMVWGLAQLLFPDKANGSLLRNKDGKIVGSALIGQNFRDPRYFHPRPSAAGSGYDPTGSGGSNLGPTSAKLFNGTTKQPPPPAPPGGAPGSAPAPAPAPTAAAIPAAAAAPAAASSPAAATADPTPAPGGGAAAPATALVVDNDGLELRVVHYCDDNVLPFEAFQDGKSVDLAPFRTSDGNWDEVKLITAFNDNDHPLTIKAARPLPADAVTASASGLDPHISIDNAMLQVPRVAKARKLKDDAVRTLVSQAIDDGLFGVAGVNVLRLNLALDMLPH